MRFRFELGVAQEKTYFIENLAMLIGYGKDIFESLASIKKELKTKTLKTIVDEIYDRVSIGESLSKALEETHFFSYNMIALIRAGEQAGTLKDNLRVIAVQEEKERIFISRIRSALLYPFFIFFMTLFVGIAVIWIFLPLLANVFYELGIAMPLITRVMLAISAFLNVHGIWLVPLLVVLVSIVIYILFFRKSTKHIGQEVIFHIPGLKKLIKEVELARFGYTCSSLLEAGLPITEVLLSLKTSTVFARYQDLYEHILASVEDGSTLQQAFENYPKIQRMFPYPIQQLLFSAEQSGSLEYITKTIGEMFEQKLETTTKNTTTLMEPVLLVIVWLVVLAVAVSVILPIYSLVGQLIQ